METLKQDMRYGWRMMAKSPGFTLTVVLMLALGIGATTAVFTIFNATLLRPLPYRNPDKLVQVMETRTSGSFQQMEASYPDYLDMRDRNQVFSEMGGYSKTTATLLGKDGAEQVPIAVASSGFFETLGIQPILGRTFRRSEDDDHKAASVILTYGGWQRRFGGDPHIIGKTLVLDDTVCPIVGVLPASFQFGPSNSTDIWRSLQMPQVFLRRNLHWFYPVGRVRPEVSVQQAQLGMDLLARQLEAEYATSNKGVGVRVIPLREQIVGSLRPVLLVVLATVAFVLLITCANVAGLLLARSVPRRREIAVRMALGAARGRIVRQVLTESLLLALIGGLAGVGAAVWAVPLIISAVPKNQLLAMPFLQDLGVDWSVLLVSLCLSVFTGIFFGMFPALQTFRGDTREALEAGGRSSGSVPHSRVRNALVVAEIAVAVVLLAGGGLMLKSLRQVLRVDPGFQTDHLLTFGLSLPDKSYPKDPDQRAFLHELLQKESVLPGVNQAAAVTVVPLSGNGNTSRFDVEGHPKAGGEEEYEANSRTISPNYFSTMGIPLRAGRLFTAQDNDKSAHVVVVNQALVNQVFPHQNPIGKRINFTYTGTPNLWEIIGVVANENVDRLDSPPTPIVYDNFEQDANGFFNLVIRTSVDPTSLAGTARNVVRQIDVGVPVFGIASMEQIIWSSPTMLLRAYPAYLVGIFAAIAVSLAALGIYGLLAYSVAQRTRELGLRMALGAQPRDLLRLVVRNGIRLTVIGSALGLVAALAASSLISTLLFGVKPTDLTTLLAVCGVLILSVAPATYFPARRATKVDPMVALRYE